jgi:hypothetical protein
LQNQDGCPPLWATDEILTFNPIKQPCGLLVPVWLLFISISCALRIFIAFRHWLYWFARQRKEYKRTLTSPQERSKRDKRLPIVPILSIVVAIMQIAFVTLVSTNTISSRSGVSLIVAVLWFHPQKLLNQLFALKLIRLGKRISPAGPRTPVEQGQIVTVSNSASQAIDDHNKRLTTWDDLHRFLVLVWFLSMIGQFIVVILAGTIQPLPWAEGFRAFVVFDILVNVSTLGTQVHQLSRVMAAIKVHTAAVMSINSSTSYEHGINQAIRRLRHQRRVIIGLGVPLFSFHGYMVVSNDFPWYLLLIFCYMEFFSIYLVARSMNVRHPQSHIASTTSNENNAHKEPQDNRLIKRGKQELTAESKPLPPIPSTAGLAETPRPLSSGTIELSGTLAAPVSLTGSKVEDFE